MVSKFVVDVNVGRLSKWLRVIGYDALFLPDANDADLLQVAQEQGRTVVTKDRYILERRVVRRGQVKAVLIQSDDFREQMRELTQTLGLSHQNGFLLPVHRVQRITAEDQQGISAGQSAAIRVPNPG